MCSRDRYGLTGLHYAVWNGHVEAVQLLCANNLGIDDDHDTNQGDAHGASAADAGSGGVSSSRRRAAGGSSPESSPVQRITKMKVSCLDLKSDMGFTALHLAAQEAPNEATIITILLKSGADTRVTDNNGITPADHARMRDRALAVDALTVDLPTPEQVAAYRHMQDKQFGVIARQQGEPPPAPKLFDGLIDLPARRAMMPDGLDMPEEYILQYGRIKDDKLTRQVSAFHGLNVANRQIALSEERKNKLAHSVENRAALYGTRALLFQE